VSPTLNTPVGQDPLQVFGGSIGATCCAVAADGGILAFLERNALCLGKGNELHQLNMFILMMANSILMMLPCEIL